MLLASCVTLISAAYMIGTGQARSWWTLWVECAALAVMLIVFTLIWHYFSSWPGLFSPVFAKVLATWLFAIVIGFFVAGIVRLLRHKPR